MKPRAQIILAVAVVLGIAAWSSMPRGARSAAVGRNGGACCPLLAALNTKLFAVSNDQPATTTATAQQVIVYYFHATVRCQTCRVIEAQAKAVVEQQFKAEMAANRLAFTPVNYELPENAHFVADYKLPCPSLVLVRQEDGKDKKWKLLGDTWQLVHAPPMLNSYVETEVRNFLYDEEHQTSANQVAPPPAPNH